jgi:hypothetical protein
LQEWVQKIKLEWEGGGRLNTINYRSSAKLFNFRDSFYSPLNVSPIEEINLIIYSVIINGETLIDKMAQVLQMFVLKYN